MRSFCIKVISRVYQTLRRKSIRCCFVWASYSLLILTVNTHAPCDSMSYCYDFQYVSWVLDQSSWKSNNIFQWLATINNILGIFQVEKLYSWACLQNPFLVVYVLSDDSSGLNCNQLVWRGKKWVFLNVTCTFAEFIAHWSALRNNHRRHSFILII